MKYHVSYIIKQTRYGHDVLDIARQEQDDFIKNILKHIAQIEYAREEDIVILAFSAIPKGL